MNRRIFLQKSASLAALLALNRFPLQALEEGSLRKLTILHTNDVHSRIEPFPMDGSALQGLGGAARRASLIKQIRSQEKNVLLLDAGDIFQGTPYYNFFGGELEFKLMSQMGYDAATLGNHDFDGGIDGLHKQLPHANFPFINSNYIAKDTLLHDVLQPYKIIQKDGIKIGLLGVGIELNGLVPTHLCKGVVYENPIEKANQMAAILKQEHHCHYVICLSHLGYSFESKKVSDLILAKNSSNIDLILGGHTHTFLEKPTEITNADGKIVTINQAGWAGVMLGRIDVFFERNFKKHCTICSNKTIQ